MSGPFGAGGLNFFSGETVFYPYLLKRSLRFNDDGSTGKDGTASRLRFQPTSTGSNTDWTISFWIKRNGLGTTQDIIDVGAGDGTGSSGSSDTNTDSIQFQSDDTIRIQRDGSQILHTNAMFRDTSAWYNIVVKSDADNGTAADKLKVYINGVDQDDSASGGGGFSVDTRSGLSNWSEIGSTDPIQIGARIYNNGNNLDAYLAEFHYVDGTALTASSFGETKEGIWIPKEYTGTHGTNGFYLNFTDDSTVAGFSAVAYTGPIPASAASGTTGTISGVGFQPDLVWIKCRSHSNNHMLFDTVRGIDSSGSKAISSNTVDTEFTSNTNGGLSEINADGFTVKAGTDTGGRSNLTGSDDRNYVSWNWQAGGAPTADNSAGAGNTPTANSVKIDGSNLGSALAGTIPATRLSANTTYGFSIVTYTGTDNAGTIAHGLGAVPKWIIVKKRTNDTQAWQVYHSDNTANPETDKLTLNTDAATVDDASTWNDTAPTSSVFSVGDGSGTNELGDTYVAYLWCEKSSFSKFGQYTGNGSATGPTVTLGFKPAFVLIKATDRTENWFIVDNARSPSNPVDEWLFPNLVNDENKGSDFDGTTMSFSSTGFQITNANDGLNKLGENYIYAAFADNRTNGFYLDQSGNGNHLAAIGLEYTDSKADLPTNNFAVWLPTYRDESGINSVTLTDGNLKVAGTGANFDISALSFVLPKSGKWYFEYTIGGEYDGWGFCKLGAEGNITGGHGLGNLSTAQGGGIQQTGWINSQSVTTNFGIGNFTAGQIHQVAIDVDGGKLYYGVNNTYYAADGGSDGNPSAGTNHLSTFDFAGNEIKLMTQVTGGGGAATSVAQNWNFGQNGTFNNTKVAQGNTDTNRIGDFFYAPPTDYLALCTDNLPDPEIDPNAGDNPEDYFNTVLYTNQTSVTGVGFAPDWVWHKSRNANYPHFLYDVVRGTGAKGLNTNNTSVEGANDGGGIVSFDSDGVTWSSDAGLSQTQAVGWFWKAGGAAVSNTDGTITSTVSANKEAGFSIVSYTGTGSAATVGHGLGKVPAWIIIKNRGTGTREWLIYHHQSEGVPENFGMFFGASPSVQPFDDDSAFNDTAPTTTVFSVKDSASTNNAGEGHIAYCFSEIEGYSKFGRYAGTGGSDNSFVYLGFRPAWFLLKRVNSTGDWVLYDNKRDAVNVGSTRLSANLLDPEISGASNYGIDFVSNGVKFRSGQADTAVSGGTYIYMAFAEQPFKYSNAR